MEDFATVATKAAICCCSYALVMEVTEDDCESQASIVFDEAETHLHTVETIRIAELEDED